MKTKDHRAPASGIVTWLLDEDLSVATLLGFLSIPFTVALSLHTRQSHYDFSVVADAALLAGLYYSNRSTAATRAGFRTGIIGGLPAAWNSVGIVASGWAISPGYAALGVVFLLFLYLFTLAFSGIGGVVDAVDRYRHRPPSALSSHRSDGSLT